MWGRVVRGFAISLILALSFAGGVWAKLDIPAPPPLDRPIVDQTRTLTDDDIARISNKINTERESKSFQIAVLMIHTLGNEDSLEDYSISVARKWGVGEKSVSNGALILVAKNDKKVRIEVGDGLEGVLTDAKSSRIIRENIAPKFRNNDYAGGIESAVQGIIDAAEGRTQKTEGDIGLNEIILRTAIYALFIFPAFGSILARSKSWWAGGVIGGIAGIGVSFLVPFTLWSVFMAIALTVFGFVFDFLVSRNYREAKKHGRKPSWWAGGDIISRGGGSSSGGSFGGGGFSGGGSSGSW